MIRRDADGEDQPSPHPRETADLLGHHAAERAMLEAYRSGRMPHAWLIGGQAGIGKATLAYRAARFILAHPDPAHREVQSAQSLAVDPSHPVFRRIAAQGHSDLLALYRTVGDTGKLRSVISVDQVRRSVSFFGSTAGEGGWRVCIVDTADDLNAEAANALLKIIEEPPARSVFFLISHTPGRLFVTIRSRCRRLMLRPLVLDDLVAAASQAAGRPSGDPELLAAAKLAGGNVGATLALMDTDSLALRERIAVMLTGLPALDGLALHKLGEQISGTEALPLATFVEAVRDWLSARLSAAETDPRHLAQVAEVWDKVNRAARDVEVYNLERKPLVFSVFGWLSHTAR